MSFGDRIVTLTVTCALSKPGYESVTENLEWRVIQTTRKAVLLQLGHRKQWWPNWAFKRLRRLCAPSVTPERVPLLLKGISEITNDFDESLVPVVEVGKGPTAAEPAFSFEVQETLGVGRLTDTHPVRLRIILPSIEVCKKRGQQFAPVSLLRKVPDSYQRLFSIWAGHHALQADFDAIFVRLKKRLVKQSGEKDEGEFDL